MAEQRSVSVLKYHVLEEVIRNGEQVTALRVKDRASGETRELRGKVFADATYEGDLAAYAGVPYRLGREGRADHNELHAGVVYQDPRTRTFLAGTTGQRDDRLQAYTYRLCLTDDPKNRAYVEEPPPGYDRNLYAGYFDDIERGLLDNGRHANTIVRAFSIAPIPNRKFDANMYPRAISYPFVEVNYGYPEADWAKREQISERIRNITLGLFYFMQNDPQVPEEHRKIALQYGLPKDEFHDSNHFPWQLYVREARRIVGEYTLTEHDLTLAPEADRPPIHADSVTAGEYPFDSMPVRKKADEDKTILEGYLLVMRNITRPYQIPYRIIVPKKVEGLLVPVAASATHIGFSSIRLEPTWMALGQAAGTAAHLAIQRGEWLRDLRPERIQRLLLEQDQVLTYFNDLDRSDPAHAALQYFGTKGFFPDYYARSREPLTNCEATRWLHLAERIVDPNAEANRACADGELSREAFADMQRQLEARLELEPEAGAGSGPVSRGEFCIRFFKLLGKGGY